jgi:hypothetical protein
MFRRSLAAIVVLFVVVSLVAAGTYNGIITKCSKDEITMKVFKDKDDKEGTEKTFKKVSDKVEITQTAGKDKDPVKKTQEEATKLVATAVEKSKQKGARATVTTEGDGDKETVTKVQFRGGKGK